MEIHQDVCRVCITLQQIGTWSFAVGYITACNNYKMQICHFVLARTLFEASTSFNG